MGTAAYYVVVHRFDGFLYNRRQSSYHDGQSPHCTRVSVDAVVDRGTDQMVRHRESERCV